MAHGTGTTPRTLSRPEAARLHVAARDRLATTPWLGSGCPTSPRARKGPEARYQDGDDALMSCCSARCRRARPRTADLIRGLRDTTDPGMGLRSSLPRWSWCPRSISGTTKAWIVGAVFRGGGGVPPVAAAGKPAASGRAGRPQRYASMSCAKELSSVDGRWSPGDGVPWRTGGGGGDDLEGTGAWRRSAVVNPVAAWCGEFIAIASCAGFPRSVRQWWDGGSHKMPETRQGRGGAERRWVAQDHEHPRRQMPDVPWREVRRSGGGCIQPGAGRGWRRWRRRGSGRICVRHWRRGGFAGQVAGAGQVVGAVKQAPQVAGRWWRRSPGGGGVQGIAGPSFMDRRQAEA